MSPTFNIPMKKKLAYSFNQVGINLLWQAFNTVAVFYYVSVLQVSATKISIGMVIYGIINAFLNLIAGHISDRTSTRLGRRIPYIVFGSLPFALLFYLLFHPFVQGANELLLYFLVITILFDLCFTFVALNINALYPEMFQTQKDRSGVAALQQIFGIIGMIVGVALSKSVGQAAGWSTMAIVFGIITVISLYTSLYGSFENHSYREEPLHFKAAIRETFKNKRFVVYVFASLMIQLTTTMFVSLTSYFTQYVVVLSSTQSSLFLGLMFVVAIPLTFVWAKVANHVSNITATIWTTILFGVISLAFCFDDHPLSVIVTGAFLGIGIAGFLVLMNVLLAEVIDYDAEKTGKRREGMYFGMNGLIVRLGMSLQYAIMGLFFAVSKFNSKLTIQPASAVHGIRFLIGGLPVIMLFISVVLLIRYRGYTKPSQPRISESYISK